MEGVGPHYSRSQKKAFLPAGEKSESGGATLPYVRVAVTHGLAEVGVHAARVGVLDLGLGAHLGGRDVPHTHVHEAWGGRESRHPPPSQGGPAFVNFLVRSRRQTAESERPDFLL